ncbi:hypothetical protein [Poriferisphaera sp. WC338]|uniref:hypothetical protein n=1 Tax=Poriferisphaera sp. WC338 TaxID=3425129 RepID=UPI003D81AD5E
MLKHLKPQHLRLILLDEDLASLKQTINSSDVAVDWFTQTKAKTGRLLDQPPLIYDLPNGKRQPRQP